MAILKNTYFYLFISQHQVLAVAHRIFSCDMCISVPWPGIKPFTGSTESQWWPPGKSQDTDIFCCCSVDSCFFFFLIFLYFNWGLITLQNCGGLCHTFTWISHGCTCVFPFLTLPPHPIPQGQPSAPARSTLSHALNPDWKSISHKII